ncbi:1,4-Dihydroxy-2-naphthoyl-CoA synthase [Geosmithia morbida]|uniref:1,4-Dihydroxy-2-naphthoyl-CoA synthase n=1 Tax=Geosmithia morbida TaxID=1094350 RepID=A0A9P4Z3F1_9HYPO|nr:1,4-Dihydroxy-2-naphthoyl-CoA synthase [Geosmithia morbida]KAF4126523.1 1,4-Dihydroxy-2-naphthoyl-CoA synthase [Geosmithia morbida]
MPDFASPPPACKVAELGFPAPHVMLVTINRQRAMNSITMDGHWEGRAIWDWYDDEPSLRVAVLTGRGDKAFSAGADLLEVRTIRADGDGSQIRPMPPSGFFGVSRRTGKKPIIAAVNGYAFGGGFEIVLNCDLVVASPSATFSLPESTRGLYAAAGGLPRLVRSFGMHTASEIAMTGRILSAQEMERHGLARVAKSPDTLIDEAFELASSIVAQSPDAIIVTRAGLRQAWETGSVERAFQLVDERYGKGLFEGDNLKIGLSAFAEKKKPEWVPSKL